MSQVSESECDVLIHRIVLTIYTLVDWVYNCRRFLAFSPPATFRSCRHLTARVHTYHLQFRDTIDFVLLKHLYLLLTVASMIRLITLNV